MRAQMTYRADFLLAALGVFLITGIEAMGIWVLFDRFGRLEGWTLAEVAFVYGLVNVSFAVADALATGFDRFANMVRMVEFDRVLLRPRSTVLQLLGQELDLRRTGRLLQGLFVLGWAVSQLSIVWDAPRVGLVLFAIAGAACLFVGLIVLKATAAFWTVELAEHDVVVEGRDEQGGEDIVALVDRALFIRTRMRIEMP